MNEIEMLIYKSSPQYAEAYRDGYEQAKREMFDMIKSMQALYGISATATVNDEQIINGGKE